MIEGVHADRLFAAKNITKRGRPPIGKRAMTDAERQHPHRKLVKHKDKRDGRRARARPCPGDDRPSPMMQNGR
jgi:hypothetical protein